VARASQPPHFLRAFFRRSLVIFFFSLSGWFSLSLLSCNFVAVSVRADLSPVMWFFLPALVLASWMILLGKIFCVLLFLLKMMNLLKLKEGRKK